MATPVYVFNMTAQLKLFRQAICSRS
ncbi:hypothetical protein JTS93_01110 [Clostridium botulinum]|nr:hypothetical protein [Clostridium botulinum]